MCGVKPTLYILQISQNVFCRFDPITNTPNQLIIINYEKDTAITNYKLRITNEKLLGSVKVKERIRIRARQTINQICN